MAKACLVLSGLGLLFSRLLLDLVNGAGNSLTPNLGSDAITLVWPNYAFAKASIEAGMLPMWNPYAAVGAPFLGDLSMGMFYPLNWLIFLFAVPLALLVIQFSTITIGIVGMWLYTRYLDLAVPARVLAVVLFSYALFTESFHPALGSSFCWMPMLLWLLQRFFDRPVTSGAWALCVVLALCFLAGFPNFFLYTCLILGVYGLVLVGYCYRDWGFAGVMPRMGLLVMALVLMVGLVAIQLLPAYELSTLSVRNVESGTGYQSGSIWENFSIGVMFRNFVLRDHAYLYANSTQIIDSGIYYLGGALLLLPFAFLPARTRRVSGALVAALVFMCLFLLSRDVAALSFLQKIPLAGSLRIHGRGVAYVQFLVIVLSAIGLSAICELAKSSQGSRSSQLDGKRLALLTAGAVFLASVVLSIPVSRWLIAGLISSVLLMWLMYARARRFLTVTQLAWLIALLIVTDVSAHRVNRFLVPAFTRADGGFIVNNARNIKKRSDHYRVLFVPATVGKAYLLANIGPRYQIPSITAYSSLTLARWENYLRYFTGQEDFDYMVSHSANTRFYGEFTPALMRMLLPVPWVLETVSLRYLLSKKEGDTVLVDALPRAYAVGQYVLAADEQESLAAIKTHRSFLGHMVVLENAVPTFPSRTASAPDNRVTIRRHTANQVELEAELAAPSLVILTDAYYPGWQAFVDGKVAAVYRANSLFRAVEVAAGKHTIVYRYHPASLRWGLIITLVSAAVITLLIVRERVWGREPPLH
ncbi:MAG: YfhO family protein [Halioglobus sp.]